MHLGVVGGHRVRDGLQHHGLAGLRRRHDEPALPLADRGDQVDDPAGGGVPRTRGVLQVEPLLRVQRDQLGEIGALRRLVRVGSVDGGDAGQHRVLLAPGPAGPAVPVARRRAGPGRAGGAFHGISLAQAELLDLGLGQDDIVRAALVAGPAQERPAVGDVQQARDRLRGAFLDRGRGSLRPGLTGLPGRRGPLTGRALGWGFGGPRRRRGLGEDCGHTENSFRKAA